MLSHSKFSIQQYSLSLIKMASILSQNDGVMADSKKAGKQNPNALG